MELPSQRWERAALGIWIRPLVRKKRNIGKSIIPVTGKRWMHSMEPSENQPFSQYTIQVFAPGYRPFTVTGIELFSGQLALQRVRLSREEAEGEKIDTIVIPVNTLFGNFPPKIAESEIKPIAETGEIVLSRVVVPEYVVVHDGAPTDPTAANYYVRYKEYIKNVASSEIYSTWGEYKK